MSFVFRTWAVIIFLLSVSQLHAEWPTKGGEGGREIVVTSLEEKGPGTLSEALDVNEPRIIKFAVAGEIWLTNTLLIKNPFVTIAGNTAPSPGISIMGDTIRVRTHDLIMRDIRVRVGARLKGSNPDNRDGLQIDGGSDGKSPSYNILVENCSVSWGIDENIQIWGGNNHDIVIRNCIIAEGMRNSIHSKGMHSAGLVVGGGLADQIVIEGNLFISNAFRNPVISSGVSAFVINNLIYNPGFNAIHFYGRDSKLAASTLQVSVIGNVIKAGPDTRPRMGMYHKSGLNAGSKIYLHDNTMTGTETLITTSRPANWAEGTSPIATEMPVPLPASVKPIPSDKVTESVLTHAGARVKDRDALDLRLIEEVKKGTGSLKDAPTDERLTINASSGVPSDTKK